MDTTKIALRIDTLEKSSGKSDIGLVETKSFEKIILKDDKTTFCDCRSVEIMIWPIMWVIIVALFRKPILELLRIISERIKGGDHFKIGMSGIEISREMNNQELTDKAEKEFKETILSDDTSEINDKVKEQDEFVPKYINIERRLFNTLLKNLHPQYRILSNRRIEGAEFDLIIESLDKIRDYDCIGEVKYFPNRINKSGVQHAKQQLSFLQTLYETTTRKKAMRILFIIIGDQVEIENYPHIFENISANDGNQNVRYLVIKESEIESIDRLHLINILNFF